MKYVLFFIFHKKHFHFFLSIIKIIQRGVRGYSNTQPTYTGIPKYYELSSFIYFHLSWVNRYSRTAYGSVIYYFKYISLQFY